MRLVDIYDLPGDKRALMISKYGEKNGNIILPEDEHQLYAFLFDAKTLCGTSPWKSTQGSDEGSGSVKRTSP